MHLKYSTPRYSDILVDVVLPGSPAQNAGIVAGDQNLAINGRKGIPLRVLSEELKHPGKVSLTLKTATFQIRTVIVSLKDPMVTKQRRIN